MASFRHGHTNPPSPEYRTWLHIKHRCLNPANKRWDRYGGRGITVCDRWKDSFENFLGDMGLRPSPDHQIERIDNDGDYTPENCTWATRADQARNRRRTRLVTWDGRTMCLKDWAAELGIRYRTLHARIVDYGWSVERAFTK